GVTTDQYNPSGALARGAAASILARSQDFSVANLTGIPVGGFRSLRAALTGANQVPGPGDANARAMVDLVGTSIPGLLCLSLLFDAGLSSAATTADVHQGAAGTAGPVVL